MQTHAKDLVQQDFDYRQTVARHLDELKVGGLYREFVPISRLAGRFPTAIYHHPGGDREITVWCSLDFMGMGQDPAVREALIRAVETSGAGSGGSRNIAGNCADHVTLERTIAEYHGCDAAILMNSGYVANWAALSSLAKILGDDCVFFSDEKNHNSIIEGIRASRCRKVIFSHNDAADLSRRVEEVPRNVPKVIVFESVYSMDGDVAPVERYVEIAEANNALSYLDEVHAIGGYGPSGAGIAEGLGCAGRVSLIQGTLGKGVGLVGGYVAGSAPLVDAIRCTAPGFIFTVSLPPYISTAARVSIERLQSAGALRERLHRTSSYLRSQAARAGIDIGPSASHIIPVMVRDGARCKRIAAYLLNDRGIYLQPVNYPSVPLGQDRLRVSVSALHTEQQVDALVDALLDALVRF